MAAGMKALANMFGLSNRGGPKRLFEAAGHGRRLRGFTPAKTHVNRALQSSGDTLIARARWLYENDGFVGNAVDEWVAASVGDGIKPRPRVKSHKKTRRALLDLFWRWTEESDAEGMSDFYGQQETIAREVFLAGECFVRIRARRPGDMLTVPFQLQILPSEMLDLSYEGPPLNPNNYVRMGIEFDGRGKRVAYHFWRYHPYDNRPMNAHTIRERVRVPAEEVIHIIERRSGGQLRGVPRVARVLVKVFGLEVYDDAELERKKTTSLFAGFLVGRGENPMVNANEDEDEDKDNDIAPMDPGAIIDLGDDRDIRFSNPAEVGGSYEPFQYRNWLRVSAGLGVPYAVVTGDVTRGNFSNVRTAIIGFRRRVRQWQYNVMAFQLLRIVWGVFVDRAVMAGLIELPGYDKDPAQWRYVECLMPRMEWIDPSKDVAAEKEEIRAGLKSRTQAVAERGYDREDLDDEIQEERGDADARGLEFDTDSPAPAANPGVADPDYEDEESEDDSRSSGHSDQDRELEDAA